MRKVRSKALWKFLLEKGVLEGTEEEIQQAKREYRKQYKREWKLRRLKQKEIRPSFTIKEYQAIQQVAEKAGLKPTGLARQLLLAHSEGNTFIPNRDILLQVLQNISIVAIHLVKQFPKEDDYTLLIEKAEQLLLTYLFTSDYQNSY